MSLITNLADMSILLTIMSSSKHQKDNKNSQWGKEKTRSMELLVDGVKNYLLPFITKLDSTNDMLRVVEDMSKINKTSRCLTLKNQHNTIKMNKGETFTSYLMRIKYLRNQFLKIGHIYDSTEITMVTSNKLCASWENFRQWVCAHSKLPKFDRLKVDYIQEV